LGEVIAVNREELDLSKAFQIRQKVQKFKPDIIINAAAYTAVDKAESEKELVFAVNTEAPKILAEEALKLDCLLVHFSTDYVFDGTHHSPYTENDRTCPLNIYGESKLGGEKAIQEVNCQHLILRTSWIYGNRGKNFLKTVIELAKKQSNLNIVEDQIVCPTWVRWVAEATAQIIAHPMENKRGLYHMSCGGEASWFQFAEAIITHISSTSPPKLNKITSENYITAAKRPKYSVLNNQKLQETFKIKFPHWLSSLNLCLKDHNYHL
jgi:dTDP-4-dehydrorhamnose reductase